MFRYYDPTSLKLEADRAAILFIDAGEGSISEVEITTPEQARQIASSLRMQRQNGISVLGGEVTTLTGSLVMTSEAGDEGLIVPDGERRAVPVSLSFDVDADSMPRNSYAKIVGAMVDGALVAAKIALKSLLPIVEPRPTHGQQLA